LNVDFKIASACIANRIKPILRNIISETQKRFLKSRYIGEFTILIYDLIDKLEEEWLFIEKNICNLMVLGHLFKNGCFRIFLIGKKFSTRDPLSPYLFIYLFLF
jgi:hypothetical protein